ncbi:hypothetical protein CBR_g17139 [Chara braunii]|uniref:RING-type E3 ubiquitin transferase n=1 Tax=Chara braunii TaxID=69332 RepID=A0A388KUR1_CHABU|nr:hypothetical protein CBR_g17139 [Chara braunii]|eukprot:GBG73800.1 hypothetical protein CBR_g17139 [Chara braunii]
MPRITMDDDVQSLVRIACAGDGLVLGLGMGLLALREWWEYRQHGSALRMIQETSVTRLSDARMMVSSTATPAVSMSASSASSSSSSSATVPAMAVVTASSSFADVEGSGFASTSESGGVHKGGRNGAAGVPTGAVGESHPPPPRGSGRAAQVGFVGTAKLTGVGVRQPRTVIAGAGGGGVGSGGGGGSAGGGAGGVDHRRQQQAPPSSSPPSTERFIIVRGKVQAKSMTEVIRSRKGEMLNKQMAESGRDFKGVIWEKTQTYLYNEMRGLFGWMTQQKEQIGVSRRTVSFGLSENPSSRDSFVAVDTSGSRQSLPLVSVYKNVIPAEPSSSTAIFHLLFGQRYPVGLLEEERMLLVNQEVTAVGHLYQGPDGLPTIKARKDFPVFLTDKDKDGLVRSMVRDSRFLWWTGVFFTVVSGGILAYSLFKHAWRWKQERRRRRGLLLGRGVGDGAYDGIVDGSSTTSGLHLVDEESDEEGAIGDGELCCVCLTRRRQAVFLQCGHRSCCFRCAMVVAEQPSACCPMCRRVITGVVRVYDP